MADKNLLQLDPAAALTGVENLHGVQSAADVRVTVQQLADFVFTKLGDNVRIKSNGTDTFFQLRDTSVGAPGWHTLWSVNGVLTLGPLETE